MYRFFGRRHEKQDPVKLTDEDDENEDGNDPQFVSQLSPTNMTCDTILGFSNDGKYLVEDEKNIGRILDDMKLCMAYDQESGRYFVKVLRGTQMLVNTYDEKEAQVYFSKYTVTYRPATKPKSGNGTAEIDLWTLMKKHAISGGMAYKGTVFYSSTPDGLFNVFYRWKYKSLPKSKPVDMYLVKPYMTLCENIFTMQSIRELFHCWVANILQNPGARNGFGFLVIGKPGTGKSTLTTFISDLTYGYSIENVDDIDKVFGAFNSSREYKVFIGLNDLFGSESTKTTDIWQKLKTPVTERVFECRQAHKKTRSAQNVNNIMISTNYEFIEVEKFDRRWQIVKTSEEHANDRKYFEPMYAMLRDAEAMQHLYTWYLRKNLDKYNPQIISNEMSVENGYTRFIRYYCSKYRDVTFTKEHISSYWYYNVDKYIKYLEDIKILECGEPLRAIYAQFVEWGKENNINERLLPQFKQFSEIISKYTDPSKPSKLFLYDESGSKEKIDVIIFKRLEDTL